MHIKEKKALFGAILISAVLMSFLLVKVEWNQFTLIAGRLNIKELLSAYCVFIVGNIIRSYRFSQLDYTGNKLKYWWNINVFYNFITSTLPGGAGEAVTAYVLKRFSTLNILSAFRILLLSRLMDLFGLSALFFVSSLLVNDHTPYRDIAIWVSATLFLLSSVALLKSTEKIILRLMKKLPGQGTLIKKLKEKLSDLLTIVEEQRRNKSFSTSLFLSLPMTIAGIVTIHLVLRSLGVDFTLFQSTYFYGVYMIFQIVPIHGIAGIGTQAAWWALALNAAGYVYPDTIALGFVLHGIFYLFITLMGAYLIFFVWKWKTIS